MVSGSSGTGPPNGKYSREELEKFFPDLASPKEKPKASTKRDLAEKPSIEQARKLAKKRVPTGTIGGTSKFDINVFKAADFTKALENLRKIRKYKLSEKELDPKTIKILDLIKKEREDCDYLDPEKELPSDEVFLNSFYKFQNQLDLSFKAIDPSSEINLSDVKEAVKYLLAIKGRSIIINYLVKVKSEFPGDNNLAEALEDSYNKACGELNAVDIFFLDAIRSLFYRNQLREETDRFDRRKI